MDGRAVAANELTQPCWDFISKQPIFKVRSCALAFLVNADILLDADRRGEAYQGYQRQARGSFWSRSGHSVARKACV